MILDTIDIKSNTKVKTLKRSFCNGENNFCNNPLADQILIPINDNTK